jgi:hypothetical protein
MISKQTESNEVKARESVSGRRLKSPGSVRFVIPAHKCANKTKALLRKGFSGQTDARGYVSMPQDNLIPGVTLDQFETDLLQGDGDELRMKFCALHSSSALGVNTFGPFKMRPQDLVILNCRGCESLRFEEKLDIGFQRKPNLDVCIKRKNEIIGVESKFLEYFALKKGKFRDKYTPHKLFWAQDCWWEAWDKAKSADKCYLDVAQLAKHYFGLARLLHDLPGFSATLLYLFWEPSNASEIEVCRRHRAEIEDLGKLVAGCRVSFRWMSYPQLWEEWTSQPHLTEHVQNLKKRYFLAL